MPSLQVFLLPGEFSLILVTSMTSWDSIWPSPHGQGKPTHHPGLTHLPGDLDALGRDRLQGDIHRRAVRSCGETNTKKHIEKVQELLTWKPPALGELHLCQLPPRLQPPCSPCPPPPGAQSGTCFLGADGELLAGLAAADLVEGVHADAVHGGGVQVHDVRLVDGRGDVACRLLEIPGIWKSSRVRQEAQHLNPVWGPQSQRGRAQAGEAPKHLQLFCPWRGAASLSRCCVSGFNFLQILSLLIFPFKCSHPTEITIFH